MVVGVAGRAARHGVQQRQRRALRLPHGVPVDERRGRAHRPLQQRKPLDLGTHRAGQVSVLGHQLDPDVHRADEPAGHRQVRRRLDRHRRRRGVQRVDEHEAGSQLRTAPAGQLGKVVEVAVAPGPPRAHRVQLGHQAPRRRPVGHRGRQVEVVGGDDQRHASVLGVRRADEGDQLVPAERQVTGNVERRLTHLPVTHGAWLDPPVDLVEPDLTAALDVDAHPHRLAVRHVHRHVGGAAGPQHHARRQGAPPGRLVGVGQCRVHRLLGVRRHAQRGQHGDDRVAGHHGVATLPVPEVGGDTVDAGEVGQLGRRDGGGGVGAGGGEVLGHRGTSVPHLPAVTRTIPAPPAGDGSVLGQPASSDQVAFAPL